MNGMLVVSKRKNAFLTEEEKAAAVERKKCKKLSIQKKQIDVCLLSLKVVSLWQHGMFMPDRQFGPKNCKQIVQFLQATYEKYRHVAAAKSFVYRVIDRHKKLADSRLTTLESSSWSQRRKSQVAETTRSQNGRIMRRAFKRAECNVENSQKDVDAELQHNNFFGNGSTHSSRPRFCMAKTMAHRYINSGTEKKECDFLRRSVVVERAGTFAGYFWLALDRWEMVGHRRPFTWTVRQGQMQSGSKDGKSGLFLFVNCLLLCPACCTASSYAFVCRFLDIKARREASKKESTSGAEFRGGEKLRASLGQQQTTR